jgi:hypothetical protein
MAITFEEAAVAFVKQLVRAEQAEARVRELEDELKTLKEKSNA